MSSLYKVGGSLPPDAPSYIRRQADEDLYKGLLAGNFCYVLNSRQMGKSSLRVQTMRRLKETGVACAAIDITKIGSQGITPEEWYAGVLFTLSHDLQLLTIQQFEDWWLAHQLLSPVNRFSEFIAGVLLKEITGNVVIFIDEIDSIISLDFQTDDFFAFIRSCYNERVDSDSYNRLSFCLLGVASPSSLIKDKNRTPFNIGKAIALKGFQPGEVEPLEKGLRGRYSSPDLVMEEILYWTGGQPFLTQKLCQFMVEESEKEHPRSVEQVVRSRIIENWESQDEPEHLRTIQARITRDEQRATYLLELYLQIILASESSHKLAEDTLEQSELQLSGLVTIQQNHLKIYNRIYQEIFNQKWIDTQLGKLRPYSESFKAWDDSHRTDESRLLRGKALQDVEKWAKDKNLSHRDREFLSASRTREEKEKLEEAQRLAELKRERTEREAAQRAREIEAAAKREAEKQLELAEAAQQMEAEAKREAERQLELAEQARRDTANQLAKAKNQLLEYEAKLAKVKNLSKEASKLQQANFVKEANESLNIAGLVLQEKIKNPNLVDALLDSSFAVGKYYLKEKNPDRDQMISKLQGIESQVTENNPTDLAILVYILYIQGKLSSEGSEKLQAYKQALEKLNQLKNLKSEEEIFSLDINILYNGNADIIDSLYRELQKQDPLNLVYYNSLKDHYFKELGYLMQNKRWKDADIKNFYVMLYLTKREKDGYLDENACRNFPKEDLRTIDQLWLKYSANRFGFSVQKQIWLKLGGKLDGKPDDDTYVKLADEVGWRKGGSWLRSYDQFIFDATKAPAGHLPAVVAGGVGGLVGGRVRGGYGGVLSSLL